MTPRATKPVLVADLFCGAGGSSTGARRALAALGLRMDLVAVNHWAVAVETHSRNHPEARHLCVDVYRTTPREAVPGGRLDLLMASPTCTFYSRARGGKPISREQRFGRMTPTQVDEPAPTICATGYVPLVRGEASAERVDILFRMLEPHELAAAMGFSDEDQAYEFAGTKEEITRQIGNAVPVRTSSALVGAIFSARAARARKAALPA